MRRPGPGSYSVESLYQDVRDNLPNDVRVERRINRYFSRGVLGRLRDGIAAARTQGDVNHITGDVHYLSYFLCRRRTVLTILDCVSLERSKGVKFWLLWFFWYWLPEKKCAVIPVISEATRQQVLKYVHCDPSKVRVIHCNVSDDFQLRVQEFNSGCPRILHVGSKQNKNLERHAAALEGIRCHLVVIGQLSASQRAALKNHRIEYTSRVGISREALIAEYRRCDLLLFASTYEGFGLPIVEAQAVGRPVVTSNLWSMPEVAGEGACLVDPHDVASIRAGVKKIMGNSNYRSTLVKQGLENVKRFRTALIAEQYAELYREVYEQSRMDPENS